MPGFRGTLATGIMGDVSQEDTWAHLVEESLSQHGKVARPLYSPAQSFRERVADLTREQWDLGIGVTLTGAWIACKHCIPEMVRSGGRANVCISTTNSTVTSSHVGFYAAAKACHNALVRSIALECGRDGIRCNAIAAGLIAGERLRARLAGDALEERMYDSVPKSVGWSGTRTGLGVH